MILQQQAMIRAATATAGRAAAAAAACLRFLYQKLMPPNGCGVPQSTITGEHDECLVLSRMHMKLQRLLLLSLVPGILSSNSTKYPISPLLSVVPRS